MNILEFLPFLESELYYYIDKFGVFIYIILFAIIFGKTGFVILTFLPGDSLAFASGTLAAVDKLNFFILFTLYFLGTSLADSNNYFIGKYLNKIPKGRNFLFNIIREKNIIQAKQFLDNYGKVAITFSRFIPLMRTLTPFIAGFTESSYKFFVHYNVLGAFIWTTIWVGSGYALGNLPWVENNLLFTLALIGVCMLIPSIYGFLFQFKNIKKLEKL